MKTWKFAGTCPPGTEDLLHRQFKQLPTDAVQVTHKESGLLVGDTTLTPQELRAYRFWRNVFVVTSEVAESASAEAILPFVTTSLLRAGLPFAAPHANTCLVRFSENGTPHPLPDHWQRAVDQTMSNLKLQPSSHRPDVELWIVRRSSGYGFVGFRLPRPRYQRRKRQSGELTPELAYILGLIAGVGRTDIVLDPFAGFGGIPREIVAGFAPRQMVVLEQNPRLLGQLRVLAEEKPSVRVVGGDALKIDQLADSSVTRVVTDPPWGQFEALPFSPDIFYSRMLREFARVLRPGGVTAILDGSDGKLVLEAQKSAQFELVKRFDILVSGKKAAILKLRRRP